MQTVSGCDSIITTNLEVIHIDNTVTQNSNQLIANQTNASYQWLNCDDNFSPIIGETNREFVAQFDGNYAVGITYNNCVDTSDCVFVEVIGIDNDFTDKKVILYSNPAENVLSIKLIGVTANRVDILDVNSKKIKEYYINNEESIINIEDLSIGIYLLRLFENQELIYQSKFVKIR
ncbi:MAG: T9SS type A sorting domain-containing protein [Bacteroidales bacterium]